MKYSVTLLLGDSSKEGHGHSEKLLVKTNLTPNALRNAYVNGCNIIGFDITQKICTSSRRSILYDNQYWTLIKAGIDVISVLCECKLVENGTENSAGFKPRYRITSIDNFKELWLNIAKIGDASLEWEEWVEPATIYIGGYGLLE